MPDTICLGELLIDFVPTTTGVTLAQAETFRKAAGGAPANVAVGLARLGVESAFMGKVGDDGFGHFLADTLRDAGVDTTPLRFDPSARTALAFVSLAADGDREFLFYRDPAADTRFAPEDIDPADIQAAKILHYGSISLITEPSRSATLHAIGLAQSAGLRLSYDPNLREALWPNRQAAEQGLRLGLQHANVMKISEEEVTFLTGDPDFRTGIRTLWHDGLDLVAVTRGPHGSHWFTRDADNAVPGVPVAAIDTTGAGDAFTAALLAGLLQSPEAPLDQLLYQANAAGALATTKRGAIPAMPTPEALATLLSASRTSTV